MKKLIFLIALLAISVDAHADTKLYGTLTLDSYDCTGNASGGKLTTDANGVVSCEDDGGGGGASLTVTDGTTTVNNVDTITFNSTYFDVVDNGSGDVTINPVVETVTIDDDLVWDETTPDLVVTPQTLVVFSASVESEETVLDSTDFDACSA